MAILRYFILFGYVLLVMFGFVLGAVVPCISLVFLLVPSSGSADLFRIMRFLGELLLGGQLLSLQLLWSLAQTLVLTLLAVVMILRQPKQSGVRGRCHG